MSASLPSAAQESPVGSDSADPQSTEEALLRQIRSGRLLARILMRFAQDPMSAMDADIELALQEVAEQLGAEHAYLILAGRDRTSWSMSHEWSPASVGPRKGRYRDVPLSFLAWTSSTLRRGEVVRIARMEDFPPEAEADRVAHLALGHRAMLIAPVKGKGGVGGGALGFDVYSGPRAWSDDEVELVSTLGSVLANVVDRQRAEEALRASEEKLSTILDLSPDIVSILDGEGRLLYNSPAAERIHGHRPGDLQGVNTFDLMHPEDQPLAAAAMAKLLAQPETVARVTYRYRDRDGSWRWMDAVASNHLHNPVLQGIVCISRDVSDRKKQEQERILLEQQLRQTQKLESLGVLAGGIAHDFNNLLMAILGNLDLALQDLPPESSVRSNVLAAEIASRGAADLSRQMLAYSGKGRFVVEPTDLNELIREIVQMLEVSISKKAQLKLRCASELPHVAADPSQLRQLVMNLLVNASDALADQSGIVSIATSVRRCDRAELSQMWLDEKLPPGRYVCLEVEDQGCGMDAETLGRIFDPFFTTKFTGRGLGLAVVLGIVRGHKGAIRVRSTPGEGTSFQVLLPVLESPPSGTAVELVPAEEWTGGGRVLLVDDEEMVRTVGAQMLTRLGFAVVTAPDGHVALELVRENLAGPAADRFVCVLLDLTMPRMDGEETCRALGRLRPNLPVVLSSGYSEQEVLPRFEGLRLAGFAQKPYVLKTLRETMRQALEKPRGA